MVRTTGIAAALSCCLILVCGQNSAVGAGILSGHAAALAGWSGSVAFDNGAGLRGDLDYAVFTAANFNANFGGLGYVPGDAVVYTYQLLNSALAGTDSISTETVGIINPANTIGTFNIGNVNASSASFVGTNAQWLFNPEIPLGMTSWGMAFSSPNLPIVGSGLTVDGGASVLVTGIPTPGDVAIPEPYSVALLGSGAMLVFLLRSWNGRVKSVRS
jgi:hypothetical protein